MLYDIWQEYSKDTAAENGKYVKITDMLIRALKVSNCNFNTTLMFLVYLKEACHGDIVS